MNKTNKGQNKHTLDVSHLSGDVSGLSGDGFPIFTPEIFKAKREALDLSREELAAQLGLSTKNGKNYIRMLELGIKKPSRLFIHCFEYFRVVRFNLDNPMNKNYEGY